MRRYPIAVHGALTLTLALAACGGGSRNVASAPPPIVVAPTPTPTPTPTPSPLQTTQSFTTVSAINRGSVSADGKLQLEAPSITETVSIRYSEDIKGYEILIPDFLAGQLIGDLSSPNYDRDYLVARGKDPSDLQDLKVLLNPGHRNGTSVSLTYTSFGHWEAGPSAVNGDTVRFGEFAFGIPTPQSEVPVTGTASYDAFVYGSVQTDRLTDQLAVGGDAHLVFDFGAGTLSGWMDPILMDDLGPTPLGRYGFVNTVYSTGSQTFSGAFLVPGTNADSGFIGQFTGPDASELMASWYAPFVSLWDNSQGTMSGVWVGKKNQ